MKKADINISDWIKLLVFHIFSVWPYILTHCEYMDIATLEQWYLPKTNKNVSVLAKEKCGQISQLSVPGATNQLCLFPHAEWFYKRPEDFEDIWTDFGAFFPKYYALCTQRQTVCLSSHYYRNIDSILLSYNIKISKHWNRSMKESKFEVKCTKGERNGKNNFFSCFFSTHFRHLDSMVTLPFTVQRFNLPLLTCFCNSYSIPDVAFGALFLGHESKN